YRQKVAALHEALAAENGGHEVREALRALVEAVVLVPDDGRLAIEVRGDLAAILALGQNASTRREGRVPEDLLVQVKLVAGARNTLHLLTSATACTPGCDTPRHFRFNFSLPFLIQCEAKAGSGSL